MAPRARSLSWLIIAGSCAPPAPPVAPTVDPDTAAFHDWKITDHVLGDEALISELDAAGFHGRAVVVAPTSYSSPWTGSCDDPHRSLAPRPLAEIARRYHVADLALREPITEFHLTCGPTDGSSRVPPLSLFVAGDRAATCWSGVCYLLSP